MTLKIYQSHGLAKLKEEAFRSIVKCGQMAVLDESRVDTYSASAVVAVLDAITPPTRIKLLDRPVESIINKCFLAIQRART